MNLWEQLLLFILELFKVNSYRKISLVALAVTVEKFYGYIILKARKSQLNPCKLIEPLQYLLVKVILSML